MEQYVKYDHVLVHIYILQKKVWESICQNINSELVIYEW